MSWTEINAIKKEKKRALDFFHILIKIIKRADKKYLENEMRSTVKLGDKDFCWINHEN